MLNFFVLPAVIVASQVDPAVLHLLFRAARTWCYRFHRTRLKILGRWISRQIVLMLINYDIIIDGFDRIKIN